MSVPRRTRRDGDRCCGSAAGVVSTDNTSTVAKVRRRRRDMYLIYRELGTGGRGKFRSPVEGV